jgi:glycosyltransferase involved in cell wall biosynthesis
LNEAKNLPHVFEFLPDSVEIILVDGRSTDDTVAVARSLRPDIVVVNQTRRGKGNALASGFMAAKGDIIVMLDADGSADPREIPAYVKALVDGADFAKGSRFTQGGGSSDITRMRRLGNRCLNLLVNTLLGCRFSDLCYGYNAFWRHCLPVLALSPGQPGTANVWGDGFEVETLVNVRVFRAGLRVVEVPSFEHPRIHGVSNLNAVSDGLRVLRTIFVESWRRHRPPERATVVADQAPAAVSTPPIVVVPRARSAPRLPRDAVAPAGPMAGLMAESARALEPSVGSDDPGLECA